MRCKICAVPGEKLAFYFFPFERPLLQNCIMHSSICTNGYFCRITLTSMLGTQLERPVLSQSDTTFRGRPRSQPVCCDQCTFHTFDPKLRFNYCWMDKMTSKSTLYFSSFINRLKKNNKKKAQILDFHQMSGGTKDKQETKLNNRRVVVTMAARSVFFSFFLFLFDSKFAFLHVFPCQLDRETGTDDTFPPSSLPSSL